ncbi:hypothetical protein [Synechococcus phage MA10]
MTSKAVVYCYHCIPTGKKYIGITVNEATRRAAHKYLSKKNSSPLYDDVRRYGWCNFVYGIIEAVDNIESARVLESYYIEKYNTVEEGYNQVRGGGGVSDNHVYHKRHRKYTPKEPYKRWEIEHKDGRIVYVANLKQYCSDNNYDYSHALCVSKGMKKEYMDIVRVYNSKSKKEVYVYEEKGKGRRANTYEILYTSGEVEVVTNLNKYAKERGYAQPNLSAVKSGKLGRYKDIVSIIKLS